MSNARNWAMALATMAASLGSNANASPIQNATDKDEKIKTEQTASVDNISDYSAKTLDLTSDFYQSLDMSLLDKALENATNLTSEDKKTIAGYTAFIKENPKTEQAKCFFEKIKQTSLTTINIFVKADQYYDAAYCENINFDNLRSSNDFLYGQMNILLSDEQVRENISSAKMTDKNGDIVKNFADMRYCIQREVINDFYNYQEIYNNYDANFAKNFYNKWSMDKKAEWMKVSPQDKELVRQKLLSGEYERDETKKNTYKEYFNYMETKSRLGTLKGKEKKEAESIIASFETNFYKKYGLDISDKYLNAETYTSPVGTVYTQLGYECEYLKDKYLKDVVYRHSLCDAMDNAYEYNGNMCCNSLNVQGKKYQIPNSVVSYFTEYARAYRDYAKGYLFHVCDVKKVKLSEEQKNMLNKASGEIIGYTNGYYNRQNEQYELMITGKQKSSEMTSGENNVGIDNYIKYAAEKEKTAHTRTEMYRLEQQYHFLKGAREHYEQKQKENSVTQSIETDISYATINNNIMR